MAPSSSSARRPACRRCAPRTGSSSGLERPLTLTPPRRGLKADALRRSPKRRRFHRMTDAPRLTRERPLSPHMQVWRWHLTMLTSILHRASGLGLYGGALIAAGWAVALAQGPETYGWYKALLGSLPGKV